jgi:para-nitrobenzyl esterase
MVMPAAKGLFHRAAVESGATLRTGDPAAAEKIAAGLLEELNISSNQCKKLQTVPTVTLITAAAATLRRIGAGHEWSPVLDGKVIPAHPFDLVGPAISKNVPLLIGTCLNEMVNGVDNPEVDTLTNEELLKRVTQKYGDRAESIIAAYKREYPKDSPFGLWEALSAAGMRQNTVTQAERKAAQGGAPV